MNTERKCSKIISIWFSLSLIFNTFVAQASADEDIASIRSNLEKRNPPIKAKSILPTAIHGIYEVYFAGSIFYMDKTNSYVFVGSTLINDTTKENITAQRLKSLSSIRFNDLPLQNAIEIKKGSGAFKFAVFTDPDCPYCKYLEESISNSNASDYTAFVFLYPLKTIHPEAAAISESIWCAKNKSEAWLSYMLKGTSPEKANCDNPINSNEELAEKLGVRGTPTIYLNTGELIQDPQDLLTVLTGKK